MHPRLLQSAYQMIVDKQQCPACQAKLEHGLDAGDDREIMTCGQCASCWTVDHGTKTVTQG